MSPRLAAIAMLWLLPAPTEAQQAVPCRGPLSEGQLTQLAKGSVPNERIGQLLASCGIDFEPTGGAIGRLRSAGIPETVLDAVRAAKGPAARKRQAEQVLWDSIKDSRDPAVFEDYIRRSPEGPFTAAARQKYKDLKLPAMRADMEQTLAAGQWDAADGKIAELLRIVPEDEEIRGWERRVADGKEAERKRKADQASWESIKDSRDPAVFEDYLSRYPQGQFSAAARQRNRDLKVAAMRADMERTLAAGQWDAAEAKIQDLARTAPASDEIAGWRRRVADGREAERKQKAEQAIWDSNKDSRDPLVFEEFLREYPGSQFAAAARLKLTALAGAKEMNPKDGLTYVWIPPGRFMMGCSPGDTQCLESERPAHPVAIARGYWLGQTLVTQRAYQRVTGQNLSHFEGVNLPVETVDWNEARAYCAATGGRLPTEAEWEYAARAGSAGARYGNLAEIGWYQGNSGGQTHEVGQKLPNAFGLYDMLGNLWQWVADWYGPYAPGAQNDPAGAESGQSKVTRGGSWNGLPGGVRVSYRGGALPGNRNLVIGFRCVGEWLKPAALKPAAPAPAPAAAVIAAPITAAAASKVTSKDGLTYNWIPPGTFQMGCSPGDAECGDNADERPGHRVAITKGFWLGRTPVTQQAYRRVTGQDPSSFKGADLPVETVNWSEAKAYCAAIGGRLPTEAEWEYAARAGSTGSRYGNLDDIAWHSGNSGGKSHEVGQKAANAFGLYDMLGNVWQWVADWYGPYAPGAKSDPAGAESGEFRMLRGGSWFDSPSLARASYRFMFEPSVRSAEIGFRCAGE